MPDLKMPDINNVLIAGNVSSEPVLRKTANGAPVVNFCVASNRKYKDNSGIWRENVCHVGIIAWHTLAEKCIAVLHVGSSVLVDGELQSRNWKNEDGSSRSIVEIRARRIQFLEPSITHDLEEITGANSGEQHTDAKQDSLQEIGPTEFDFGYQNLKL
ncbi:single-stranded DNA-binding protein [candidate division KSB1 bacterium]|nr:single-stranded DNA-binding protein [candidate division KSB1 bacterium]RQV99915.1 MAG: single-stranded DNA-binding protein [candidate division KSB1 bacterium]